MLLMEGSFSNFVVAENPPWALESTGAAGWTTVEVEAPSYGIFFANAIRTKLSSLYGTSQSIEFDRQLLLALHDSSLTRVQAELVEHTLGPQLYDAYSVAIPRPPLPRQVFVINDILPRLEDFLASSHALELRQLLLLHLFSFLDRVADYWNAIAQARAAWLIDLVLVAFRQQLKSGLLFKPLHKPIRFLRSSVHPIEVSA